MQTTSLDSTIKMECPKIATPLGQSTTDLDSESDIAKAWCPGDGICPTESEFLSCFQSSFKSWSQAADIYRQTSISHEGCLEAFLGLFQNVPPFFREPPKDVDLTGGTKAPLVLRSSFHIHTTEELECDKQWKCLDYLQCLGFPQPAVCEISVEPGTPCNVTFAAKVLQPEYLSSISLAWSYILSSRWVEILRSAGQDSVLLHQIGDSVSESFWDMVTQCRWVACLKRASCFSPWMLMRDRKFSKKDHDWVSVQPNSSLAFNVLLEFCTSGGFEREFLVGLTSVLLLPSRNLPPPKMSSPIPISRPPATCPLDYTLYHGILRRMDNILSLSATQDALESIACSAFFDPSVPCNLVGSASLGLEQACLQHAGPSQKRLLNAISNKAPKLSLLWLSLVMNDQALPLLKLALRRLPPINLVAAFLTETQQSFLQVNYCQTHAESTIIRAREFQTSFYCRAETSVPWTPSPPFGITTYDNLSLEISAHYGHKHKPLSWVALWKLRSGDTIPMSMICQPSSDPIRIMQCLDSVDADHGGIQRFPGHHSREYADEQSWSATSRLYNWHRRYDDGLWLDDGNSGVAQVRLFQQHPWIVDPFHFSDQDDPTVEEKKECLNKQDILKWAAGVQ